MPKFNLGWLKMKNGEKFAPKTFLSQILQADGSLFQNRVERIENMLTQHDNRFTENEAIHNDYENRIKKHEERYSATQITLADKVNGYNYIIEMRNGNLVSYNACESIMITGTDRFNYKVIVNCQDGSTRTLNASDYTFSNAVFGNRYIIRVEYKENGEVFTTSASFAM